MLNEDKIKLMTEISFYEKKQKKKVSNAEDYFKGDYIGKYMVIGVFKYTVAYSLAILLYMIYVMGDMARVVKITDFIEVFKQYMIYYLIGLFVYEIITWIIWNRRYEASKDAQGIYVSKLRRLQKRYEFQNKTKELSREEMENA
jgi:hypothetical protein